MDPALPVKVVNSSEPETDPASEIPESKGSMNLTVPEMARNLTEPKESTDSTGGKPAGRRRYG
jgi:hypothetical protein